MITLEKIAKVRQLATDAIRQYSDGYLSGGCPVYPDWDDDWLDVCAYAENKLRAEQLERTEA